MRRVIELSLQPFMHAGEHAMFLKFHLTPCELCQLCHLYAHVWFSRAKVGGHTLVSIP